MVLDSVVGYYELPVPPNYHCKFPCMWVRKHGICISKVGGDLVQICPLIFVVALRKGWRFISCWCYGVLLNTQKVHFAKSCIRRHWHLLAVDICIFNLRTEPNDHFHSRSHGSVEKGNKFWCVGGFCIYLVFLLLLVPCWLQYWTCSQQHFADSCQNVNLFSPSCSGGKEMICSAPAKWSYCNYSINREPKYVDLHGSFEPILVESVQNSLTSKCQFDKTWRSFKCDYCRFNLILIWIFIVLIVTVWSLYNLSVFWYEEVFVLCFVISVIEVGETIQAFLKFVVFSFCSIWWWRVIGKFLKWQNCFLPSHCIVTIGFFYQVLYIFIVIFAFDKAGLHLDKVKATVTFSK